MFRTLYTELFDLFFAILGMFYVFCAFVQEKEQFGEVKAFGAVSDDSVKK